MSQVSFVKQNNLETISKLRALKACGGEVTLWVKGKKEKKTFKVKDFNEQRKEILLDSFEQSFNLGSKILCAFDVRGQSFFSEVTFDLQLRKYVIITFNFDLYASEKRSHFRLLTYPLYNIYIDLPLDEDSSESEEVHNIISFKKSSERTELFKSFIDLIKSESNEERDKLKFRVYNLSVSGLLLFVGKFEFSFFKKDQIFHDVTLYFEKEVLTIPTLRVMHLSKAPEKFMNDLGHKIGMQFENLPQEIDSKLGEKINTLLREVDDSEDFEKFIK